MAEYGLLVDVVPTSEFEDAAMALAEQLAAGPPIAQRYTKRALLAGRESLRRASSSRRRRSGRWSTPRT